MPQHGPFPPSPLQLTHDDVVYFTSLLLQPEATHTHTHPQSRKHTRMHAPMRAHTHTRTNLRKVKLQDTFEVPNAEKQCACTHTQTVTYAVQIREEQHQAEWVATDLQTAVAANLELLDCHMSSISQQGQPEQGHTVPATTVGPQIANPLQALQQTRRGTRKEKALKECNTLMGHTAREGGREGTR